MLDNKPFFLSSHPSHLARAHPFKQAIQSTSHQLANLLLYLKRKFQTIKRIFQTHSGIYPVSIILAAKYCFNSKWYLACSKCSLNTGHCSSLPDYSSSQMKKAAQRRTHLLISLLHSSHPLTETWQDLRRMQFASYCSQS